MRTADFDYELPSELIAQRPARKRESSRMLVLERASGRCEIRNFPDLREYLRPGDCLVLNDARVMPARLFGVRVRDGGRLRVELLLLRPVADTVVAPGGGERWAALARPARRLRPGDVVKLLDRSGNATKNEIVMVGRDQEETIVEFAASADAIMAQCGHIPLPPYISRDDEAEDAERYQTVYAAVPGAVAAPTAGLHFTSEILAQMQRDGLAVTKLTLAVGAGTFRPVTAEDPREHRMHAERYHLSEATAASINRARAGGGRVVAVGTTVVRVLESCLGPDGLVRPGSGATALFMFPPYRPRAVDVLLTNFHLPRSTLLMLVCCFAPREQVLVAYRLAVQERMRFYSYGDCMLLV